ncbi:MAG: hypothetical protein DRI90_26630 [Deltaproteobacteria bacterium]|nr:MAG: hypothetical protein DRI90_26630 [Deltaproteobacteria bacterium]
MLQSTEMMSRTGLRFFRTIAMTVVVLTASSSALAQDNSSRPPPQYGVQVERNPTLKVAGMVVTGVAAVPAATGIGLLFQAKAAEEECIAADRDCGWAGAMETFGGGFFLALAGLDLVAGISMWAVGAGTVTVDPDDPRARPDSSSHVSAIPTLALSPTGVQIGWKF